MRKVSTDALGSLLRDKEAALRVAEVRLREAEQVYDQQLAEVQRLTADIADLKADLA